MSVRTITRVWEHSKQSSTDLLLLLAIADHADDDGICWPGIKRLADKTRTSERQTIRNVEKLAQSGEIFLSRQCGRGNSNLYFITTGLTQDEIATILQSRFELDNTEANRVAEHIKKGDTGDSIYQEKKVTSSAIKGDIQRKKVTPVTLKGDIAMSPEPLEPSIKPSKKIDTRFIPAFKVYIDITKHYGITDHWRNRMNEVVGDSPDDLVFWGQVVEGHTGCGWFKGNVKLMLEYYQRHEIPGAYKNGASRNGHQKEGSQQNRQAQTGNSPTALEHPNQQGSGLGRVSQGLGDALKARARTGSGST